MKENGKEIKELKGCRLLDFLHKFKFEYYIEYGYDNGWYHILVGEDKYVIEDIKVAISKESELLKFLSNYSNELKIFIRKNKLKKIK